MSVHNLADYHERNSDKEKLRRYAYTCGQYSDEVRRLRAEKPYLFWEGFVLGAGLMTFIWWVI